MPNFNRIINNLKNEWFCSYHKGNIIIGRIIKHEPGFIASHSNYTELYLIKNAYGIFNDKFIEQETIKDASFVMHNNDIMRRPKRQDYNYILVKKLFED